MSSKGLKGQDRTDQNQRSNGQEPTDRTVPVTKLMYLLPHTSKTKVRKQKSGMNFWRATRHWQSTHHTKNDAFKILMR